MQLLARPGRRVGPARVARASVRVAVALRERVLA